MWKGLILVQYPHSCSFEMMARQKMTQVQNPDRLVVIEIRFFPSAMLSLCPTSSQ